MNARSPRIIRWLWRARLLVVALAAADFIAMWIHDSRIEWESIDYHGYYADTLYAFVLLLCIALLVERSHLDLDGCGASVDAYILCASISPSARNLKRARCLNS